MGEFNFVTGSSLKMDYKCDDEWMCNIKTENSSAESVAFSCVEPTYVDCMGESNTAAPGEPNNYELGDVTGEDDPLLKPARKRVRSINKEETTEERLARLSRMSAYSAQRLAKETPEQRAARLERMLEYQAKRVETPEQRQLRLKRMSEYSARRLAKEAPEERARRLARMSAYAAQRIANETPEQRKKRLQRMSEYAAKRKLAQKILQFVNTSEKSTN